MPRARKQQPAPVQKGLKKGLKTDPVVITKVAPVKKSPRVVLDDIQRPEKVQGLYKKV